MFIYSIKVNIFTWYCEQRDGSIIHIQEL